MNVRKRVISVVGVPEDEVLRTAQMITDDSNDAAVDQVIVEFREPLAEAMADMAWAWPEKQDFFHPRPPKPILHRVKLSNALCRFKVSVAGVQKVPTRRDSTVTLLVGSYMDYKARAIEMIDCLEQNVKNPRIREIHLFIEDPVPQWENWLRFGAWEVSDSEITMENAPSLAAPPVKYDALEKLDRLRKDPKVKVVLFGRRPFFSEYFDYANRELAGRTVVLSNSDIQFGEDVGVLAEHDFKDVLGNLARNGGRIFDKPPGAPASMSADAWMFQPPVTRLGHCNFPLGVRAGEYHLSFSAMTSGYLLVNPCLTVYGKHCHATTVRHWPRFPWITSRLHSIPGISMEAFRTSRFQEARRKAVAR